MKFRLGYPRAVACLFVYPLSTCEFQQKALSILDNAQTPWPAK